MITIADMIPDATRTRWTYGAPRGDRTHRGIDVYAPVGAPIYSPENAQVLGAGETPVAGKWVAIQGDRYRWSFSHLAAISATPGQRINAGDLLGHAGATGIEESAPHTHIEVNRGTIDPRDVIMESTDKDATIDIYATERTEDERVEAFAIASDRMDASLRRAKDSIPKIKDPGKQAQMTRHFEQIIERRAMLDQWPISDDEEADAIDQARYVWGAQLLANMANKLDIAASDALKQGPIDRIVQPFASAASSAGIIIAGAAIVAAAVLLSSRRG